MNELKSSHYRGLAASYLIIGILALVGGAVSLNYRVKGITPYLYSLDPTPGPIQTEAQKRLQELADMRLLDSDSDGLNDFDEEYTYTTSAYLADSDSDGIDDPTEIAAGDDPTCAEGKTCEQTRTANVNATSTTNQSITTLPTDDPDELRRQLVALGIPKSVLDSVSDEDLVAVYASVSTDYASTQTATPLDPNQNVNSATTNEAADPYSNLLVNTNAANSNVSTAQTYEDFKQLKADDIRQLLITSGVSADDLNQIDDATLEQLFQQALAEQATEQTQTQP